MSYQVFISQLRNWTSALQPKNNGKTVWGDYFVYNTYQYEEAKIKRQLIFAFAKRNHPKMLVDLGCNAGDYSFAALEGGAEYVIGYDFDHKVIDLAYSRSEKSNASFLPLWLNASNLSLEQGWMQRERERISTRNSVDAVIALAFEHHLAFGKNIPLKEVIGWIVGLAPTGLIEFIPKNDETIQKMQTLRKDIFSYYDQITFEKALAYEYGSCKLNNKDISKLKNNL